MAINGRVYGNVLDPFLSYEGSIELPQLIKEECRNAIHELEEAEHFLLKEKLKAVALMRDTSVIDLRLKELVEAKRKIIQEIFDRGGC